MTQIRNMNAALLTTGQCYAADHLALQSGVQGISLMENAGKAVFDVIQRHYSPRDTYVICGPGNNGGDGFVVARLLAAHGWPVRVGFLGDAASLPTDAAAMLGRLELPVEAVSAKYLTENTLVVDALFGAGLDRPVARDVGAVIDACQGREVVSIDMPSGVNGDSGLIQGKAFQARHTVSFFRPKPGHFLYPGRACRGKLHIADIGLGTDFLAPLKPRIWHNMPELWSADFPAARWSDHKFSRGYALLAGGKDMIGAIKLSARAAQRIGAGMVTIASPEKSAPLYRLSRDSVVVKAYRDTAYYKDILADKRIDACLIGPGLGQDFTAQEKVLATLRSGSPVVLDADALTMFEGHRELLFDAVDAQSVLTPHEGEFMRLFPDLQGEDKISRCRKAAEICGCTVLLKGPDTVIAHPNGTVVVNDNGPPELATAGAGDVLAGLVVGLIARKVSAFQACLIGSWIHGAAASSFGPGLIAEDIAEQIPAVLTEIKKILI